MKVWLLCWSVLYIVKLFGDVLDFCFSVGIDIDCGDNRGVVEGCVGDYVVGVNNWYGRNICGMGFIECV